MPALLDALLSLGTDLELPATLQHIVDSATSLTGARYGALGVIDPDRGTLSDLYTCGMSDEERERIGKLPAGDAGIVGLLIRDPRPLLIDDLTRDPRSSGVPEGHPVMRSFLGVPVRVHTEVFGNLYLTEKHGGPFTPEDLALLRVLASRAGIAIGNARLYETARQRERWIEGAAAVTTALLTGSSAEDALMTVAEQARNLAGAAAGVVLQPTADGGMEIVAASTAGAAPDDIVGTTIAPGSPVLVQLLGGEPVFVEDSATDPRMTTHVRTRFGPSMMLPLQSGGRLIGTLALPRSRNGRPYSSLEKLLASQFASQAALALVMADTRHNRARLAVFEDRDRIARDLHDLVVQRLFATEMMLESTRRRAGPGAADELIGRAVDELDSTIQEVRTTIFALQQPPAEAPTGFRGRVLRETAGAAALLGFPPSVQFRGPVDALVRAPDGERLITALRSALAAAHRRPGVGAVEVVVDATARLADGSPVLRLTVGDDVSPGEPTVWETGRGT
ncbi:GAF domain-containing protein [Streptomyces tsukubensis]|uniref:Histidine kinase n=1 Tax=Streptomyces tsukubensis (strain DSM 42081 / NBRC 108919 / NRRL 18488 / 9993) TaxID=1114943 RepID=A0A7G3UNF2_STRT9|nr:GAF domain-containing protein [Streptomyces tsukubensis]AZK98340.1 histidine kinase [Streptomyces tsukubensis]QKM71874.1 histidine kinase [Streptomyces tsukubensis NRRL18488]TAI46531.1 GAF domain-containing protein [Streptomyces tsukubensis]